MTIFPRYNKGWITTNYQYPATNGYDVVCTFLKVLGLSVLCATIVLVSYGL